MKFFPSFVEIQKTASSETTLEPWVVDLEKFQMISDFADRYEREGNGRLDLLVMNAGMHTIYHSACESGWEKWCVIPSSQSYQRGLTANNSIQVNHLGTSLLTLLLLPYIKRAPFSPPMPRIVFIGSEVHLFVTLKTQAKAQNILKALNEDKSSR